MSDLYAAIAAAREVGEAKTLWVRRCDKGCRLAGAYRVRGRDAVLLASYRPNMWMRVEYDLPRKVEGEAWLAGDRPDAEYAVGCKHGGGLLSITRDLRPSDVVAVKPDTPDTTERDVTPASG